MKTGKLYKVIRNGHSNPQVGDVVVCLKKLKICSIYILGLNLRTKKRHHYVISNLEELCQSSK